MTDRRCTATTARGRPCRNHPMPGLAVCASHLPVGRRGRAEVVDETVTSQLEQLLRAGNYVEVACRAAGVRRQRFYEWLELGDPADTDPAAEPYRAFRARIDRARAEGEARNVAIIAQAAANSWQAAAWLLERSNPERWDKPSQRDRLKAAAGDDREPATADPPPQDEFADLDELAARRRKTS